MSNHDYEVIGADDWDDPEVEGSVMGSVMGYGGPMEYDEVDGEDEVVEVIGYDDNGNEVVGKRRRRRRPSRRRRISVHKPGWRTNQLAPGVIAPDQGMLPLPLTGQPSNTFSAGVTNITFEGQIQKPFRGERLLVSVVRTGDTAVGRIIGQLFVGTDLNQLDVAGFDIEQVGDPAAFGVRLAMKPAQPGVFLRLVCALSNPLSNADTIFASVAILGRAIH